MASIQSNVFCICTLLLGTQDILDLIVCCLFMFKHTFAALLLLLVKTLYSPDMDLNTTTAGFYFLCKMYQIGSLRVSMAVSTRVSGHILNVQWRI